MLFDLEAAQGEWFYFFGSHVSPSTGEWIYEDPVSDAKVQIRSITPFIEDRQAKRKRVVERIYNPKTRAMDRDSFFQDLTPEEVKAERDDMIDYAITGIENFKNSRTGELITCTRENKLALLKVPVFDRFVARCWQTLGEAGVKKSEEAAKNS
jgi:hypothetical protein